MSAPHFSRELSLPKTPSSAFLFGPRMTGKTTLLTPLKAARYFHLMDPALELKLRASPQLFWEELRALPPGALIIVDEI